jgi:beta-1,2-mannobiose phosphorylase / 1,2-beta-oligomannan phosphorylase
MPKATLIGLAILAATAASFGQLSEPAPADTAGGWVKYEHNPVLSDQYGICFDVSVLHEGDLFRMWVSWRPQKSIALVESPDGLHFSGPPRIVLAPAPTGWEDAVNRPSLVKRADGYHLWYEGQNKTNSFVGYATSPDGVSWKRWGDHPVMRPDVPWEKAAIQGADIMWDEGAHAYKMWYSGGPQSESDAIGYASSPDGVTWTKWPGNPIFRGDPNLYWEKERAVGCHVEKEGGWYYMFYIGFSDIAHAQLGVARSRDGITGWQRLPQNPILRLGTGKWDNSSCYKPYTILDGSTWRLWYGGRSGHAEQVGLATHEGADLGFPAN